MNDNKDITFTSLEEYRQYYSKQKDKATDKESNRYYKIGMEVAKLVSENTLRTINLYNK